MTKIIKTDSYTQDKALGLEEVAAAPGFTADTGFVYTKDDGGDTELYYEDAAGTEVQITKDGALSVSADKLVNTPYEVALSAADGSLTFTETGTPVTLGRLELSANNCTYIGSVAGTAQAATDNIGIGKDVLKSVTIPDASYNTIVGNLSGDAITEGDSNCLFGYSSGSSITTGANNVMAGYGSGANLTADSSSNVIIGSGAESTAAVAVDNVVAIGYEAAKANTADGTVAIGYKAGDANIGGTGNTFLGYQAGSAVISSGYNTYVGYQAGLAGTGNSNTVVGHLAGDAATFSGNSNCLFGRDSGTGLTSGSNNVFMGYNSGGNVTSAGYGVAIGASALANFQGGNYNIAIGSGALTGAGATSTGTKNIAIGEGSGGSAMTSGSYNVLIGGNAGDAISTGSGTVAIGHGAASAISTAIGGTYIGYNAGLLTTGAGNTLIGYIAGDAISSGTNNVALGYNAGGSINLGSENVFVGTNAGTYVSGAATECVVIGSGAGGSGAVTGVVAIGRNAGASNTANGTVAIGYKAGNFLSSGLYNTFIGYESGFGNTPANLTGAHNTALGYHSGYLLQGAGASNTLIGSEAGDAITTSTNNTIIGHQAGSAINTTANGNNSTLIGYQAGLAATGTDNILIGKGAGSSITTGDYNITIGPITGVADAQRTFKVGYHASNEPILSGVMYDGAAGSGTDDSSELQTNVQLFKVRDPENDYEQFRAYEGKLSTYGEAAPDVDVGGFCQLMASGSDEAYSIKLTGLTHGLTSAMETDTFYKIKHSSSASPEIYAISTQTSAAQATTPALKFFGYARTSSKIKADNWLTGIRAVFEFDAAKHDGSNTLSALSDTEALFAVFNYKTPKFGITGNGNVYANAYSDVLDEEDDIKLVQSFSNPKTNPYYDRLKDLGVITGDMMCMNKMNMLSIGAIGQLFNVIRGLAKKLGVSEDELYDLAKQY